MARQHNYENYRFKKINGDVTAYGFACGHIQENKETGVYLEFECAATNLYNIKGGNAPYWEQETGLGPARRHFKRRITQVKKELKKEKELSCQKV